MSIALVKDIVVKDFDLRCRMRSTDTPGGHRDLCVFFGVQDASQGYYAHIGQQADAVSHQVHIVNNAARKPIATWRNRGVNWDNAWHDVRVARDVEGGTVEVFFDGERVIQANDTTFPIGRVGIGSFDNTGDFDHFKLYGDKVD